MKMSAFVRIGLVVLSVLLSLGMVASIHAASVSGSALQQKKSTPAAPAAPAQGAPSIAPPAPSTPAGAGGMKKEMMKKVGNIIVETTTWEYGVARIKAKLLDLKGMPINNAKICEGKKIDWDCWSISWPGTTAGCTPLNQACATTDSNGNALIDLSLRKYPIYPSPWTPGNHNVYVIYNRLIQENAFYTPDVTKEYATGKGQIVITAAKTYFDVSNPQVFPKAGHIGHQVCGIDLNATATREAVSSAFFEDGSSPKVTDGTGATPIAVSAGVSGGCFDWSPTGLSNPGQPRQFHFKVKYNGSKYYLPAEASFTISENRF